MTDTLQNVAIIMLSAAFTIHQLAGNHGEHWFALDTIARMYEKLELRVRELERRDA